MADITVKELKEKMDSGEDLNLIDVREEYEWDEGHLPHAQHIAMGDIPHRMEDLEHMKDQEVIICCRSGGRSGQVAQFLRQKGFKNVRNLIGGVSEWKREIDPSFNVG